MTGFPEGIELKRIFENKPGIGISRATASANKEKLSEREPAAGIKDNRVYSSVQKKLVSLMNTSARIVTAIAPVQFAWTTEGVNPVLARDQSGRDTVRDLNEQNYTVIKVTPGTVTRQYYLDEERTVEDGDPVTTPRYGSHRRGTREIRISNARTDGQAASTLVHEVAHANQHAANEETQPGEEPPYPTVLAKEIDSHIRQERFNLAANLPPKRPQFRTVEGEINEEAIRAFITEVYGIGVGGGRRPNRIIATEGLDDIEEIHPWPDII